MGRVVKLSLPQRRLSGSIILEPSKSLSNRALIIRSLCEESFDIHHLSSSDDTRVLQSMLTSGGETLFAGHAGSSFRFMVARACVGEKEVIVDGSAQLRRRPIGPLVRALQALGADIHYLQKEGYPPLRIKPSPGFGNKASEVSLSAGVSSQFISALLMIAPCLPNGMTLHLTEDPVSISYLHMTLRMMDYFGISHVWEGHTIRIEPGKYIARNYAVEGDWSAASYYYSMAALSEAATIDIGGLNELSLQGDQAVVRIYETLGLKTHFHAGGIAITKEQTAIPIEAFQYDFSACPDIAQTVMVTLAGLGIHSRLDGLKTLRIKETDRLLAMQTELTKVRTKIEIIESGDNLSCQLSGKARWKDKGKFDTYADHRMAMSLAPLACIHPITIRDADVVSKSYPGFWKDVESLGFEIK